MWRKSFRAEPEPLNKPDAVRCRMAEEGEELFSLRNENNPGSSRSSITTIIDNRYFANYFLLFFLSTASISLFIAISYDFTGISRIDGKGSDTLASAPTVL